MPQLLAGGLLVIHGLITAIIGMGVLLSPNRLAVAVPSWFDWWPGPFGRSWLLDALHLGTGGSLAGGLLWAASGAALIAAGLGIVGVPALREQWALLGLVGGGLGLVALGLYFHPIYVAAILINAVLVILVWERLAPAT